MKSRSDVANEVLRIEKEIEDIKDFMRFLEFEQTIHPANRFTSVFVKRKVETVFLGVVKQARQVQIRIPDKLNTEIAAKCTVWVQELEKRSEALLHTTP